jgi:hypothetical protein
MQKLGMRPVPGIIRVTVKKSKNVRFQTAHEHKRVQTARMSIYAYALIVIHGSHHPLPPPTS